MEKEHITTQDIKDPEYIKLYKMTKNYNWEIKIYTKGEETAEKLLKRLKKIDTELHKEYDSIDID